MKLLKRVLLILLALIVLIFAAAIVLPIIYEDEIVALVKEQANENLNAELDFGDYDLSLISTFPNFGLSIEDLEVENKEPFEGTTLADIGKMTVVVDLMSVIRGNTYKIREVSLREPKIHVIVDGEGRANYNIALPAEDSAAVEEEAAPADTGAPLKMALQEYSITDAELIYDDLSLSYYMKASGLDHRGSGDFTMSEFTLSTETSIESLDMNYDRVKYADKVDVDLQADLGVDLDAFKFTFKENELRMNELLLGFDGYFAMPEEGFDMDIDFQTKKTDFRTLLSMVPVVYTEGFEDIETTGELNLSGHVKGMYSDELMPGFGLDLNVQNGSFHYPDLPESVENIRMDLSVDREEAPSLDNTIVDLPQFHMEMAGNPFDLEFHLATPISDPAIDCDLKAQLDLASIAKVVPMEGHEYVGHITADMEMKGRMSTIEAEEYEDFHAQGKILAQDMIYKSSSLPYDVSIKNSIFNFSPEYLELAKFESTLGQSDLSLQGRVDNYIAYALEGETLKGEFDLNSQRFDMNELMASPEGEEEQEEEGATDADAESEAETADMSVIEVPENVDLTLNAEMGKVLYGEMDISDIKGSIGIEDRVASLKDLNMNLFDGLVVLNGTYNTQDPTRPKVDFDYDVQDLDIQKTASKVNTVEKLAPLAKGTQGKFSSEMNFNTALKQDMGPDYESMQGKGKVQARDIYVEKFEPLNKLAGELGIDRLAKQRIQDVNISFEVQDGKVHVDPYTVQLEGSKATIQGYTTFEQKMNYSIDMEVPREKLGGSANKMMEDLVAQANKKGANVSLGETIPVRVKMTGTVQEPKIGIDMQRGGDKGVKEQVEEKVKEEVEKAKEKVKEKAGEKAIEEARKQGDKLVKEAEERAEQIRREARKQRDKVIEEGEKRGNKLVDEAKNPIAKQAAKKSKEKIMKEARKEGDKKVKQADEKADRIVEEAKKKRQNLIDEAKEKSGQ